MFRSFVAGQLATLRELTLFYAPNINSYKRFVDGSFAPTAVAWGMDNRTCALRVVGHGHGMRMECRAPGGDVNQYLAVAALIAGGLHGIDQELELPEPCAGNAYTSGAERLPTTLAEAAALFESSTVATGGVRRRGRRALPEQCARRVERLQLGGDRLGEAPWFRTPLTRRPARRPAGARPHDLPAAGADRRVGRDGQLPARHLHRRRHVGRRHRHAAAAAAGGRRHRRPRARRAGRAGASPAARDVDPADLRPDAAPEHRRAGQATATPGSSRCCAGRCARDCRCSESAAAPRSSTSRSAARCTSTCPTWSATPGTRRATPVFTTSAIRTVPGTRLAALIGESTDAQCYHHQAIAELGQGLIATAWDSRRRHRGRRDTRGALRRGRAVASRGTPRRSAPVRRRRRGRRGRTLGKTRQLEKGTPRERQSTLINPATEEVLRTVELARRRRRRRRGRPREVRAEAVGQARPRRAGRRAAGVRRRRWTPTSTSWPRWRWPTPGT